MANKKTVELQKKVAEDGITPLDFMLQVMRSKSEDPARRLDAAKSAAQYVHPKLAAQSLTVDTIVSIETELKDILSRD